jgi:hypothetical protein
MDDEIIVSIDIQEDEDFEILAIEDDISSFIPIEDDISFFETEEVESYVSDDEEGICTFESIIFITQ